jgi:hypothetical protein
MAAAEPLPEAAGEAAVPDQKYDGVAPGRATKNPLPSAPLEGAYLVWTGFHMTANGSEVFLQTTRAISVEHARSSRSAVVIRLRECRIYMANNRRKIDTRYFATPVSSVLAKQRGKDVEVRIALRAPASVDEHSQAGPDGTQFVVLEFPPGKAASVPSVPELAAGGEGGMGELKGDLDDGRSRDVRRRR